MATGEVKYEHILLCSLEPTFDGNGALMQWMGDISLGQSGHHTVVAGSQKSRKNNTMSRLRLKSAKSVVKKSDFAIHEFIVSCCAKNRRG